jgi:Xaa-Pro aminopeptidase
MSAPRRRRDRVLEWLAEHDLDAMLVKSPANMRYLTGFTGEGFAVVAVVGQAVSTDSRYAIEAKEEARGYKTVMSPDGHLAGAIKFLGEIECRALAFESEAMTYGEYETLRKKLRGVKLKGVKGVVEERRRVKDSAEIALIRQAAAIADRALAPLLATPPLGITEKEFALRLQTEMLRAGADSIAFDTIAAVGPNAARPHAVPGSDVLRRGQMLKVDCGACLGGYRSDITRTVFLGKPTRQFREVYSAVYEAQQAAVRAVRAGVEAAELDRIARRVLDERGYGDKFGHGLGHGVGLQVHEGPGLGSRSKDVLQKGMVVTVEPGVYIEGWGGVRVEDTVLVTARGCEVLTNTPKLEFG